MWVYRVTFDDGGTATCPRDTFYDDPMREFRHNFPHGKIVGVELINGLGKRIPDTLLPSCYDEAEALRGAPDDAGADRSAL